MTPFHSKYIQPCREAQDRVFVCIVYCHCHMPHDGEERMAQCTGCKEWYHESCENIGPQAVFKDDSNDWKYKVCNLLERNSLLR